MPSPDALKVMIDHQQKRIKEHPSSCAWRGLDFNGSGADCFISTVNNTLMLRPMCFYSVWDSTHTGLYAKLSIGGGIEVKTSAKWVATDALNVGAQTFIKCNDSSGEYARTSSYPGLNRGMWLMFHNYGPGDDAVLDCGWSNGTSPTAANASIGLRLFGNGTVEVYKDGTLVGSYSIGSTPKDQLIRMAIIPCRRRELMVVRAEGHSQAGFSHVFEDIDEDETAPIIVPADTKFFIAPGSGGSASIQAQFAPLLFPATGFAITVPFKLAIPPSLDKELVVWGNPIFTGITNASIYGHKAFAPATDQTDVSSVSILEGDGATAFVPNGARDEVTLKITLQGATSGSTASYSPFIYGAMVEWGAIFAQTDNSEEQEVTARLMRECTLEVPDDPLGVIFSGELKETDALAELAPNILTQPRPVKLELGSVYLLNGIMRKPRFKDGILDEVRRLQFEVHAWESRLKTYQNRQRRPMDGWPLCEPSDQFSAVKYVLEQVGKIPERMLLSSLAYTIGEAPDRNGEEWNLAWEVGETAEDMLQKLFRLCSDVVWGLYPMADGTQFRWLKPADLDTEPKVTLYRSIAESIELGGHDEEDAYRWVYNDFHEEPLGIEGNEILATGIDIRTGAIVQARVVDETSADPTTAPSLRPDNWEGEPLLIGVSARSIRNINDAEKVVEGLTPIATAIRSVCEWSVPALVLYDDGDDHWLPAWRTDLFNLDGIGEKRCSGLSARFLLETDTFVAREARYTGGAILGRGGRTVAEIQSHHEVRMSKRGYSDLSQFPLLPNSPPDFVRVLP